MMNKKSQQLKMPHGTANSKLHKIILFDLIKKLNLNYCFQCSAEIKNITELSIEHKIPYLDSEDPIKLFFDINNIAFSHLKCNVKAARPKLVTHPSRNSYVNNGCRCDECKKINSDYKKINKKVKSM